MAKKQFLQSLSELNQQIASLVDEQNQLRQKLEELQKRNKELEELHLSDARKHEQDLKDIEYLTMSHRLAGSPETIISTRRKIIGLIRTIDNCIRMISEE